MVRPYISGDMITFWAISKVLHIYDQTNVIVVTTLY